MIWYIHEELLRYHPESGTNMNISKDPPKSIHTKKKDKVGDTQDAFNVSCIR